MRWIITFALFQTPSKRGGDSLPFSGNMFITITDKFQTPSKRGGDSLRRGAVSSSFLSASFKPLQSGAVIRWKESILFALKAEEFQTPSKRGGDSLRFAGAYQQNLQYVSNPFKAGR